jgi:hypothetical protein
MAKDRTAVGSKKFKEEKLSLRTKGGYNSAAMYGEHVPRIVRLIKANPGLTSNEIYNLRKFSFQMSTLRTILVAAKARGEIYFEKSNIITEEARYYVCPTPDTTEEVGGNLTSLND